MISESRRKLPAFVALGTFYLASRFFHLDALPMFLDESIYLFWARRIVTDGRIWRPLADGKSLQTWILALVVPWVEDPLWWGRAVSVAAGAVGMWAAWALGRRLRDEWAGIVAASLYAICPFALFHDRMVLADVFLSSAAALTLLGSIALVDRPSPRRAILLGLALAACVLSKVPGLLVFTTPLLAAALSQRAPGALARGLALAYGIAVTLSAFPVFYFFRYAHWVQERASLSEGELDPSAVFGRNLGTVTGWLWTYWTPALLVIGVVALVMAAIQRRRAEMLLGACAVVPILAFVSLSKSWFPRYVFLATIPFLVLVAISLARAFGRVRAWVPRAKWGIAVLAGLFLVALLRPAFDFAWPLLKRPEMAPFPPVDRFQYVEGWTAGYGRTEVARALRRERARSPEGIVVAITGTGKHGWRPLQAMLRALFMNDPGVVIELGDPLDPSSNVALEAHAAGRPLFVAFASEDGTFPPTLGPPLLVDRRPSGVAGTALYRLSPVVSPR
jgi:4-amino-4-deoxy-L-arabinose transferase-like glycosyltransferase